MCSGSEAGSYLRLIDFVYHSTLGLRVIKREKDRQLRSARQGMLSRSLPGSWKREFKLPWREAGPPHHHDDEVDSDQ